MFLEMTYAQVGLVSADEFRAKLECPDLRTDPQGVRRKVRHDQETWGFP